MPARLVSLDDGPSLLLDRPILLLGRHPECDVQIESRKISRRHCCIAQVNTYLVIRDLGSTNGIRINGVRVIEGRLASGDEVTIGNLRYQVSWDSCHEIEMPPPGRQQAHPAEAIRPTVDMRDEDAFLESSDRPVPLEDPEENADPPQEGSFSHIIPDDLHLAPSSDSLHPHPGGSSK